MSTIRLRDNKRGSRTGGWLNDVFCDHCFELILNDISVGYKHTLRALVHGQMSHSVDEVSDGRDFSQWSITVMQMFQEAERSDVICCCSVELNWNLVYTIGRATVSSSKKRRWVIRDIGALAVTVVTASLARGEKLARQISWKIYT